MLSGGELRGRSELAEKLSPQATCWDGIAMGGKKRP